MATATKEESKKLFGDRSVEKFRVREHLVVRLTKEKTYKPGEPVEMDAQQYQRHAHQVETEEQYRSRQEKSEVRSQKSEVRSQKSEGK